MKNLKEQFITYVVGEAVKRAGAARPRVMDLGCGTAGYVPQLMAQFPNIEYVGVEPIPASFAAAEKNLAGIPNTKLHFQLGYDSVPDEQEGSFDVVFSLSALEHIKQLDKFIALAAKYVKKGGVMMHRYDLGHALTPHSLKERLHVFLGNTVPQWLPERQFVRYVDVPEVKALYERCGVTPTDVTYHQMPNHKKFEKFFRNSETTAVDDLFAWEMKHQSSFKEIPEHERERLFPAVAVWGEKR
jgi:SAM-dependent methyltransferase